MHLITKIKIKNFKSIKECSLELTNYTPLVGYNNAGKSNILKALKWLLAKSSLDESYFNDKTEAIVVEGRIEGITEEILNLLTQAQKNSIEPYIVEQKLDIKRVQSSPSISAKYINLEVKRINEEEWYTNPNGLDAALKKLFPDPIEIGAMENAAEDVTKSKNHTTIGKLIAEIMEPIEENHTTAITKALDDLKKKFDADGEERAEELSSFDREATEKLQDFFPGISIKLHVPTPIIKDIFKSGTLRVYENGIGRDLTSFGHGTQRTIQMTLIQYLAELKQGSIARTSNTLLLIDEPELYLHPQAIEQVRYGLKILSNNGYQVVFSTHSPQMIPSEDIKHTLLIRKNETDGTHSRKRLKNAVEEAERELTSQFELLFSLENANQILFSEKVLLAEGKTEKRLLPYIFQKFHNQSLGQCKIAFTDLGGSANTYKAMKVLEKMDLPCKAIVDLDFAFKEAPKNGLLEDDDNDLVNCKNKFSQNPDIELSEDGLPKKSGKLNAAQAYKWLSEQEDIKENIENLHNKLKENNIWLWTKGAIEEHLGLQGKNETEWAKFKKRLDEEIFEDIINDDKVKEMLNWLIDE